MSIGKICRILENEFDIDPSVMSKAEVLDVWEKVYKPIAESAGILDAYNF